MANPETERDQMRTALKAADGCLSVDEIGALVHRQTPESQRGATLAHLAQCPACAAEMRMLEEFEGATVRPDEFAAVSSIVTQLERNSAQIFGREPWWKRLGQMFNFAQASAALSALLAVVAVGMYLRTPGEPGLNSGTGGAPVYRAGAIRGLTPSGDVTAAPDTLKWEPVAGAASYEVKIIEVDQTELWSATSAGASVTLPSGVRSRLVPAKTVQWKVVARNAAGAVLVESALESLRVKP